MNPVKNLFPASRLTLVTRITPQQTQERRARFTPEMKHAFKLSIFESVMRRNGRDPDEFRKLLDALEGHHLQPVSLGGHPTDPNNIVLVAPYIHRTMHSLIGRQLDFSKQGYIFLPYPDKGCRIVLRPDCQIKCEGFQCPYP